MRNILVSLALCFTALLSNAQDHSTSHGSDEGDYDPTPVIMHHIADAHEFHIIDINEHPYTMPLPIILWTENGLVTFMSSAFHHDDAATHVVEKGGQRFVKFHEKIYYASAEADAHGAYVEMDEEHHALNSKPVDISITKNVFSMFLSGIILMLIFGGAAKFYNKTKGSPEAPKGIAAFVEPLILFVRDDIAKPNVGEHKYEKFTPYLLSVFFFIWLNNIMGLIPFFPFSANVTGNISFTLVMATFTFLVTQINGNKDYWKHIFNTPGVPWWLKFPLPLMPIVELVGIFSKPFALMIRLFANITAGHIIILSLVSLIFIFKSVSIAPVSMAFAIFMNLLELLVAFLQAYVFTLLSALFIGMAVEEHEHH